MIPSEQDTRRVMIERLDVITGHAKCETQASCERHKGHIGAHYAQMIELGKPCHVRWPNGRTWALYPRLAARRRDNQAKPRGDKP